MNLHDSITAQDSGIIHSCKKQLQSYRGLHNV